MSVFEDVNNMYALIVEIVKLKTLIRCPICLDIVRDPLEISCGHIYCSDCIDTFISETTSKLNCPLCRKNIKRQRQRPNHNILQLIKFVTTVSEKLRNYFGCDTWSNAENVHSILNKNSNDTIVSKTEGKEKSIKFTKSIESSPENILLNTPVKNKEDAFDLLVESSPNELMFRKDTNVKTYTRKKKEEEKEKVFCQKLVNFEDDGYRLKIVEWLHDSENKFNRLTQTQSIIDDDSDSIASSFDMPSISQNMEPASFASKSNGSNRKRTRSLEVKVKQPKIGSRRYSSPGETSEELENIHIEEAESDKDVLAKEKINILQMLEERCLNTIESELAIQNEENPSPKAPKKRKKRKRKINTGTKATTRGWIRANEINKTFSKTVRGPKKLFVSLSSSSKLEKKCVVKDLSNIKNVAPINFNNSEMAKPVVILNRLSSEFELRKHTPDIEQPKGYNFEDQIPSKSDANVDLNINNKEVHTKIHSEISTDTLEGVDQCDITQSNIKNKSSGPSGSIFSQNNKEQKIVSETDIDNVEKNLIILFSSPEQKRNGGIVVRDTPVREATVVNEIDSLLRQLNNTSSILDTLYKYNNSVDEIKLCIQKLKLMFNNLKITRDSNEPINQLENEKRNHVTTQTVTLDAKSIAVQTEDYNSSGFKISSTADFRTLAQCNVEVQTDFISGDLELEAKVSKILHCELKNTMEARKSTETMICEAPISIFSNTSDTNSSSSLQQMLINNKSPELIDDDYQFTGSMDNINFDTQVILNQNKMNYISTKKENCVMTKMDTETHKQVKKKLIFKEPGEIDNEKCRIPSTADFKTLAQCNVEVRTDFISGDLEHEAKVSKILHCELKNRTEARKSTETTICQAPISMSSNTCDNNSSSSLREMLINNNKSPKSTEDDYQFTESMDNINFDTQAILNQNKMSNSTKKENRLMTKMNTETHKQVKKKLIVKEPGDIDDEKCINDQDIEIIEIEDSVSLPIDTEKGNKEDCKKKTTQNSTLSFSLDLNKYNKNALNAETIKRFKRVRAVMEDCDSDDGFAKKIKKRENPYLNCDLSVEFVSQEDTEKIDDEKTTELNLMSQSLNHDYYIEEIMQKYELSNTKTSTPKKVLQATTKQTKSQRIIDRCNALIKQATASPPVFSPPNEVCSAYNNITSADVIKEFDSTFDGTVIAKQRKESTSTQRNLQNNKEKNDLELTSCNNTVNEVPLQDMPFSNMEYITHEFENELELIPVYNDESDQTSRLKYNLEEEWQKMEDTDKNSVKSEEVFSDYDTDVIETTPQKNKTSVLPIRQSHHKHSTSIIPGHLEESLDIILATDTISYLNQTFDPPTEFQDCMIVNDDEERVSLEDTDKFDITLVPINTTKDQDNIYLDKTLTETNYLHPQPTRDSKQRNKIIECDIDNVLDKSESNTLEQCDTKNSLNIAQVNRDPHPIERVLKSNYNPLEIISPKPQCKQVLSMSACPKIQKSILSYVNSGLNGTRQRISNLPAAVEQMKPCIACSRLSKDQVIAICALTNKKLATYSTSFNSNVTHMIVSLKENNCVEHHTMKFMLAVAAGIWVIGFEWIQECLLRNKIVPEEPFEAVDVSGVPGPRTSRLTKLQNPLFKEFKIHPAPPFASITKEDLEKVIAMLGGEIIPTLEALDGKSGIPLIIAETNATQDFGIYETWLENFKVVTVDIEWLCRSVGQYQLISLKPFILCSDEHINELGYPEALLVDTPLSQSTYTS